MNWWEEDILKIENIMLLSKFPDKKVWIKEKLFG